MTQQTTSLPTRAEVPVELTWDLTTIFADEAAWEEAFQRAAAYPAKFAQYKGRLNRSGRILLEVLTLSNEASQLLNRVYLWAHLNSDVDTKNSHFSGLVDRVKKLSSELSAARAWITPELTKLKPARREAFIAKYPGLAVYRHQFEELDREREHILPAEVEQVMAMLSVPLSAPQAIFGKLNNADLKLPEVELPGGDKAALTQGNYSEVFLRSPDREVRRRGFQAMMGTYHGLRNTIAATYAGSVAIDVFRAKARGYKSARHAALDGINVPESVYDNLIATVHANLHLLNRYMQIRQRVLGLPDLHHYDLYTPLVASADRSITYPEAQELVLAAVQPLGDEYVSILRRGYNSRWIDVVESQGKRNGAYQSSVFGTNPFMLLNWVDALESAFTLGHESGHAMHSWYSKTTQPYPYAGYTIFVAEVASTVNEQLMAHHLLATVDDPALRLHIINRQLEAVRTTIIRQTMFAEFEHVAHAAAEAGKPLTADSLCEMYLALVQKYYGGASIVDPEIAIEWARIPHFYNRFYVYQYATGLSAATALSRQILTEGKPAAERYLRFLRSGSSDYSINLLRDAGVDMSTPLPVQQAFDTFRDYLDQFEKSL